MSALDIVVNHVKGNGDRIGDEATAELAEMKYVIKNMYLHYPANAPSKPFITAKRLIEKWAKEKP